MHKRRKKSSNILWKRFLKKLLLLLLDKGPSVWYDSRRNPDGKNADGKEKPFIEGK